VARTKALEEEAGGGVTACLLVVNAVMTTAEDTNDVVRPWQMVVKSKIWA
jgi:hypothetical protein